MSSVLRGFAQPLTKTFGVTQEPGAYLLTDDAFATWVAANPGKITVVSEDLYIVPGTDADNKFSDVVSGANANVRLGGDGTSIVIPDRKSLIDMGKEVSIGNLVNPRLLVLRRVRVYGTEESGGDGQAGYITVQNNCSDLDNDAGRFTVRLARV